VWDASDFEVRGAWSVAADLSIAMLGSRPYDEMASAQEMLVERRHAGDAGDLLLVLEHPPTYTRGRRTEPEDLHHDAGWYRERGIDVFDTPRGGRVTYHGPGQLVAYPIVDLRRVGEQPAGGGRADVAGFVTTLETAMIRTVARWQVPAGAIDGLTGIWTGDGDPIPPGATAETMAGPVARGDVRKIGSIGLRISRGVSSHGISLNLDCDLSPFTGITSCGIENCRVTSVLEETGSAPSIGVAGLALGEELAELIGRSPVVIAPEEIGLSPATTANP
jgi:lipoyl(octanoyl) transferase